MEDTLPILFRFTVQRRVVNPSWAMKQGDNTGRRSLVRLLMANILYEISIILSGSRTQAFACCNMDVPTLRSPSSSSKGMCCKVTIAWYPPRHVYASRRFLLPREKFHPTIGPAKSVRHTTDAAQALTFVMFGRLRRHGRAEPRTRSQTAEFVAARHRPSMSEWTGTEAR